jgi:hypothetical protein
MWRMTGVSRGVNLSACHRKSREKKGKKRNNASMLSLSQKPIRQNGMGHANGNGRMVNVPRLMALI